ncbi:MAG: helix-turn-helix domain-containing protein [Actinomycetota bacterium]|jgi:excisionase family DNA binding protein|nr:helix-turn-helix domain-containing protein [Actinomycetota bacterium]
MSVTPLTCAREKRVTATGGNAGTAGTNLALAVPPELIEALAARVAEILDERQRPAAPEMLTVGEAAELLRCRRQRVYDLLSQGRLPHLKDGARVLIRRAELFGYLESVEH